MIKNKKYIILFITLFFISIFSSIVVNAFAETTIEDLFEENYYLYDVVDIPEIADGNTTLTGTVYTPDGKAYKTTSIRLETCGYYSVKYKNKGVIKYEESFFVYHPKCFVGDNGNAISYQTTPYSNGEKDLLVKLGYGEVFNCDKIINLSNKTLTDDILSMYIVPNAQNSADFEFLYIKFTDIYDESKSFTVRLQAYSAEVTSSYVLVGVGDQDLVGRNYNGVIWTNCWGFYNWISFCGKPISGNMYQNLIKIRYDEPTKSVYMPYHILGENALVADLDDGNYFDNAFEGFTTNEVKLSIYCDGYKGSSASFALVNIDGDDLSSNILEDNKAPSITDVGVLPVGVKNCAYKIPKTTAFDETDGFLDVNTSVYFAYNSTLQQSCTINDGKFVPSRVGEYTIEYKAIDSLGNEAIKTKTINVVEDKKEIIIELGDKQLQGVAGELVSVAECSAYCNEENYGNINVEIEVTDSNNIHYEVKDNIFRSIDFGTYTVMYKAMSDNGVENTMSYQIFIEHNDMPVFFDDVILPENFQSGKTYIVPSLCAYDLRDGTAVEIKTQVYYETYEGEKLSVDNKVLPLAKYGEENYTKIIYRAVLGTKTAVKEYSVRTVQTKNGSKYDYSKYFITNNLTASNTENGISLLSCIDNASAEFLNEVNQEVLSLTLQVNGDKNIFDRIDCYFTDSVNEKQSFKVSIYRSPEIISKVSYIGINGGLRRYPIQGTFYKPQNSDGSMESDTLELFLKYNFSTKTITDQVNPSIQIKKTIYGEPFEGFGSGAVKIKVCLCGVQGESELYWKAIANQYFVNLKGRDIIEPTAIFTKDYGGDHKLGDEFLVPSVKVYDFLSNNIYSNVTVYNPDGDIVTDINGLLMESVNADKDYKIKCDKYGQYIVEYLAWDDEENTNYSLGFLVCVCDNECPTITLKSTPKTTCKINQKVVIPDILVKDNYSSNITITKVCVMPDGSRCVLASKTLIPQAEGKYVINYIVLDENGNCSMLNYTIIVSK